ncbi:hypothetical protein, partial [Pseudomonas amygdali]|uniref:hypothetical protein n=1 Tax=Pseudomonas amygdali TaxID=47877 RepID=UPI001C557102
LQRGEAVQKLTGRSQIMLGVQPCLFHENQPLTCPALFKGLESLLEFRGPTNPAALLFALG